MIEVTPLLKAAPLWLFSLCMLLGLALHVAMKVDAWWKPEFARKDDGITWRSYFSEYPMRSIVSVLSTVITAILLWESDVRNVWAAVTTGYMGNSLLDSLLGKRVPK